MSFHRQNELRPLGTFFSSFLSFYLSWIFDEWIFSSAATRVSGSAAAPLIAEGHDRSDHLGAQVLDGGVLGGAEEFSMPRGGRKVKAPKIKDLLVRGN